MSLRRESRSLRVVAGAVIALALLASGCADGSVDVDAGAAVGAAAEAPPSTSVAVPTTTTTTTTTTVPSPTSAPLDPLATEVAHIVERVDYLEVFVEPDGEPAQLEFAITNPTYFGNPLALMITDRSDDGEWLEVQVPVRPNGTEGWIRAADATVSQHTFHAEVNLTARTVQVWEGEELVAETGAVIGAPASPTPLGRFFVNDFVEKWEGSAYGPWILSLSAFSEALDTFAGGVPVIAIHGTNRPELIGGAHSNGCIRIPNDVVRVLAETVPVGTPVDIIV